MADLTKLQGCGPALITPFCEDKSLDLAALKKLVDFQLDNEVDFIVPCGTTGESATLTFQEHMQVVETTIQQVNGRVPVIAGAGSNNTQHVIEMAQAVEALGSDGVLSVVPYYNKPSQEGLYEHFKAIAESISIPIVLYNIPGRTGINMSNDTVIRLAEIDNIIAMKEATGNLAQMTDLAMRKPDDFILLSGDDANALALIALGGKGLISVAANEMPKACTKFVHACLEGNFEKAIELQKQIYPLMKDNFIDTNPVPVKAALHMMGLIPGPYYRLPMVPMNEDKLVQFRKTLQQMGLVD